MTQQQSIAPTPGSRIEIPPDLEEAIEGYLPGSSQPLAVADASPLSWSAAAPTQTTRVGWILKQNGQELSNFGFSINPQAITRTDTTRTQLYGTRDSFYVDDFGPGPKSIQINQLLAKGKAEQAGAFETLREHVLRFYDTIYTPAVGPGYTNVPVEVFFYDNHLYSGVPGSGTIPEHVYFPPQGFQVLRSVGLHNVWQVQITMVSLEKPQGPQEAAALLHGKGKTKPYVVKQTQSLTKFASRHAAKKNPTSKQISAYEKAIIKLNPTVVKSRVVSVFSPLNLQTPIESRQANRNQLIAGELLTVPN